MLLLLLLLLLLYTQMDFRLKHNSSLLCVGPSQSGKTTFIRKLLAYRKDTGIFDRALGDVHWYYGTYCPELVQLKNTEGYKLYDGLPTSLDDIKPFDVVVLDDLMEEARDSKLVTELFTRTVHHRPCFLVMLNQNLYHQSKDAKTRQINTKYLIVFKNPRDQCQIDVLGRQMFPKRPHFLTDVFEDATRSAYGYLFIDLHQDTPKQCRLRARILPSEKPQILYIDR